MKKLLLFSLFFFFSIKPCLASVNTANQYILMDEVTGRIIKGKNYHTPMLIASITKILTCIIAIETTNLDATVIVDETINEAYGSAIYIEVGEKIKLRDLLYGLMLRSGNDAALMIAKYIGGNVENFVSMMNQKAKDLGMKNSNFSNPSGLDNTDQGNYSTSYDMAILTRYAMQFDEYKKIVSTKSHKVKTNKKTYIWKNKNKLLNESYITGGKTGYTEKAKRTLVSTGSSNSMNFIVVTINDSDDWNTHKSLYNYAFSNYKAYKVLNKNKFTVIGDKYYKGNFYIKNNVIIPLKQTELTDIYGKIELVKKNNYKNKDKVGEYLIYLDKNLIAKEDIYISTLTNKNKKRNIFSILKGIIK